MEGFFFFSVDSSTKVRSDEDVVEEGKSDLRLPILITPRVLALDTELPIVIYYMIKKKVRFKNYFPLRYTLKYNNTTMKFTYLEHNINIELIR